MTGAQLTVEGDIAVLTGVVDFDSVPALVERVESLGGTRFAAVDAAGVTRIDSAGAAFLVWLRKHHARDEGALGLRAAPDQLARLLAVTGLDVVVG